MSAAHTEGLLAVSEQAAHILKSLDELGPTTELIGSTMGDNADANARRLAACWNAFDGMPTEAPEELAEIGGVQGLTNDLSAAMTVIEVARTLLSDALETFDENQHQDHEIADRIRAFLKGGAA